MEENEVFNAAVDMYTGLLFEQKDLLFRIIEASYKRGYDAAVNMQHDEKPKEYGRAPKK